MREGRGRSKIGGAADAKAVGENLVDDGGNGGGGGDPGAGCEGGGGNGLLIMINDVAAGVGDYRGGTRQTTDSRCYC